MANPFFTQSEHSPLVIDGSAGEGGGQILRTSLTLSALTGRPFQLEKIRAGRSRPGLRPQHLTAVLATAAICQAELKGAEIDSQTLFFQPTTPPQPGRYLFDVTDAAPKKRSAGAVSLILQTILWPLLFADQSSFVTLRGGTHVNYSPSFHYIQHVARPTFSQFGATFDLELIEYGWMPNGGGQIGISIEPVGQLEGIKLESADRSALICGQAIVTNLPGHIPHRMARRADNLIAEAGEKSQIEARRLKGASAGAGLFLWLENGQAGSGGLGRKGWAAQEVAADAVEPLLAFVNSRSAIDEHLADQILLPAALAATQNGERTRYTTNRVTEHTLTNARLIQRWLPVTVQIKGEKDQFGEVEVAALKTDK